MYHLSNKFPSKRAFITGAASGLGKALAIELAGDGWVIGMGDINTVGLDEVTELVKSSGGKPIAFALNTSDKQAYKKVAESFLAETGGIDLLVNNAGVACGAFFEEIPLEDWEWITGINFMGVVHGCHFFLPVMKQQKSGHVVNISSAASFVNPPRMAPYNATKAAVLSLSETLRVELNDFNIGVSAVMPTFFRTNIMHSSRTAPDAKEFGHYVVETSNLEAIDVAKEILKKAGDNKLYIVLPRFARWLFLFKRFFPSLIRTFSIKMSRNNKKIKEKLKKRYLKMQNQ